MRFKIGDSCELGSAALIILYAYKPLYSFETQEDLHSITILDYKALSVRLRRDVLLYIVQYCQICFDYTEVESFYAY